MALAGEISVDTGTDHPVVIRYFAPWGCERDETVQRELAGQAGQILGLVDAIPGATGEDPQATVPDQGVEQPASQASTTTTGG